MLSPFRCFSISTVRPGIGALLSILLELWTDRSPINLSSANHVQRGEGSGRSGRDGHSAGEEEGSRVVTHSSLGRGPTLVVCECVCVYVYVCV